MLLIPVVWSAALVRTHGARAQPQRGDGRMTLVVGAVREEGDLLGMDLPQEAELLEQLKDGGEEVG